MVSEIGLDCWQLGAIGGLWTIAKEVLETAVENGVTFFDTADVYGRGHSEELIGGYLRPLAPKAFIAKNALAAN